MELEEMIKQYLEQALAKTESAPEPQAEPVVAQKAVDAVTKNELAEILQGFAAQVAESVQKALPAPEREPGAGRKGVEKNGVSPEGEQPDEVAALISKAIDPTQIDKLNSEEKEVLYRLQYEYLTAGLKK